MGEGRYPYALRNKLPFLRWMRPLDSISLLVKIFKIAFCQEILPIHISLQLKWVDTKTF